MAQIPPAFILPLLSPLSTTLRYSYSRCQSSNLLRGNPDLGRALSSLSKPLPKNVFVRLRYWLATSAQPNFSSRTSRNRVALLPHPLHMFNYLAPKLELVCQFFVPLTPPNYDLLFTKNW